jgi:hypothetical protein
MCFCPLPTAQGPLPYINCPLLTVCRPMFTVHRPRSLAQCLLPTAIYAVHSLQSIPHCPVCPESTTHYLLPLVCYQLPTITVHFPLPTVHCQLSYDHCSLPLLLIIVYCPLPTVFLSTVHCPGSNAHGPLPFIYLLTVCRPMFTFHFPWSIDHCLLPTDHSLLPTVHSPFPAVQCVQCPTHYLLLTVYCLCLLPTANHHCPLSTVHCLAAKLKEFVSTECKFKLFSTSHHHVRKLIEPKMQQIYRMHSGQLAVDNGELAVDNGE